ncbi:MAG: hypothetical protein GY862_33380, partial [Gammaproteobacteria bacterium]|nr:hypothetical protein [Gammaproteobacteria bacterium]
DEPMRPSLPALLNSAKPLALDETHYFKLQRKQSAWSGSFTLKQPRRELTLSVQGPSGKTLHYRMFRGEQELELTSLGNHRARLDLPLPSDDYAVVIDMAAKDVPACGQAVTVSVRMQAGPSCPEPNRLLLPELLANAETIQPGTEHQFALRRNNLSWSGKFSLKQTRRLTVGLQSPSDKELKYRLFRNGRQFDLAQLDKAKRGHYVVIVGMPERNAPACTGSVAATIRVDTAPPAVTVPSCPKLSRPSLSKLLRAPKTIRLGEERRFEFLRSRLSWSGKFTLEQAHRHLAINLKKIHGKKLSHRLFHEKQELDLAQLGDMQAGNYVVVVEIPNGDAPVCMGTVPTAIRVDATPLPPLCPEPERPSLTELFNDAETMLPDERHRFQLRRNRLSWSGKFTLEQARQLTINLQGSPGRKLSYRVFRNKEKFDLAGLEEVQSGDYIVMVDMPEGDAPACEESVDASIRVNTAPSIPSCPEPARLSLPELLAGAEAIQPGEKHGFNLRRDRLNWAGEFTLQDWRRLEISLPDLPGTGLSYQLFRDNKQVPNLTRLPNHGARLKDAQPGRYTVAVDLAGQDAPKCTEAVAASIQITAIERAIEEKECQVKGLPVQVTDEDGLLTDQRTVRKLQVLVDSGSTSITKVFPRKGEKDVLIVRTQWHGGLQDLIFYTEDGSGRPDTGALTMTIEQVSHDEPSMIVTGGNGACQYRSPKAVINHPFIKPTTKSIPHHFSNNAEFLAHNFKLLTDTQGCNLNYQSRKFNVQFQVENREIIGMPKGVKIISKTVGDDAQVEKAVFTPDGRTRVRMFNRKTILHYQQVGADGKPLAALQQVYPSDVVCRAFRKSAADNVIAFKFEKPDLDPARLDLGFADSALRKLIEAQGYDNLAFQAVWHSRGKEVAKSEKKSVPNTGRKLDKKGIYVLRLDANERLVPGRYQMELRWWTHRWQPDYHSRRFNWYSKLAGNLTKGKQFGVVGPFRKKENIGSDSLLFKPNPEDIARGIAQNYFFEAALRDRDIEWIMKDEEKEGWPAEVRYNFAHAIIEEFNRSGTLPFIPRHPGDVGVAEELLKALAIVSFEKHPTSGGESFPSALGGKFDKRQRAALRFLAPRFDRLPPQFAQGRDKAVEDAICELRKRLPEFDETPPAWFPEC